MTQVIFTSVDTGNRTATFKVNGVDVTRPIAEGVTSGDLQSHLEALAAGLASEFQSEATLDTSSLTLEPGQVLIDTSNA